MANKICKNCEDPVKDKRKHFCCPRCEWEFKGEEPEDTPKRKNVPLPDPDTFFETRIKPNLLKKTFHQPVTLASLPKQYRAFDVENQKMKYSDELKAEGVTMDCEGNLVKDGQILKYIPLFRTGMLDKKHQPVWEGDICQIVIEVNSPQRTGMLVIKGVMAWHPTNMQYYLHCENEEVQQGKTMDITKLGNIFEHRNKLDE